MGYIWVNIIIDKNNACLPVLILGGAVGNKGLLDLGSKAGKSSILGTGLGLLSCDAAVEGWDCVWESLVCFFLAVHCTDAELLTTGGAAPPSKAGKFML